MMDLTQALRDSIDAVQLRRYGSAFVVGKAYEATPVVINHNVVPSRVPISAYDKPYAEADVTMAVNRYLYGAQ